MAMLSSPGLAMMASALAAAGSADFAFWKNSKIVQENLKKYIHVYNS